MNRRSALLSILATSLSVPFLGAAASPAPERPLELDRILGTIRREKNGKWSALNDATHRSQGIAKVEVYQNKCLKITYTKKAKFVGTFIATPDETLSKADIRMGPSVGLEFAYLYLYKGSSQVPVNPHTVTNASANIWIDASNWV